MEIAYSLINYFKDRVKIVAVLRDPADIFASSKHKAGNYPLMYIARHWRKNIAIAQHLKLLHPGQVHLLRYEELCANPLPTYNDLIRRILPSGHNLPVEQLPMPKDDVGNLFLKNSSYGRVLTSFSIDQQSIGTFRSVLSSQERQWLRYLCIVSYLDDLNFDSLVFDSSNESISEPLDPYPSRDKSTIANWFTASYPDYDTKTFLNYHLSLERERFQNLYSPSSPHSVDSMLNITEQV